MADDPVAVIAGHIEAAVGAARTVYRYGVPDGPLPERYLLVTGSPGVTSSDNASGMADMRAPTVDVTSVSRDADPATAGREALWGSRRAVDALTDYRPGLGRASWFVEHLSSFGPRRDESLPEVVMVAVERYLLRYQP